MDARRSIVTRASLVEDNGSPITSSTPDAGARIGEVKRVTKETNVAVRINLDGLGIADSSTGIPFLDHMLDLVEHFFQSLVNTSGMTLHIRQLAGKNSHHIIEATFKAFARALRQATEYDPRRHGTVPSNRLVMKML
ncbi:hypothetical protein C3L33_02789, partial [Rhododendron williamsianum]